MLPSTEIALRLDFIESQKHSNLDKVLESVYNLMRSLEDIKWLSAPKSCALAAVNITTGVPGIGSFFHGPRGQGWLCMYIK